MPKYNNLTLQFDCGEKITGELIVNPNLVSQGGVYERSQLRINFINHSTAHGAEGANLLDGNQLIIGRVVRTIGGASFNFYNTTSPIRG